MSTKLTRRGNPLGRSRAVPAEVDAYVKARLRLEYEGGETLVELAGRLRCTDVHVGYLIKGQRSVGYGFALAAAAYWGLTQPQLWELAAVTRPPRSPVTLPFGQQAEWPLARAEAGELYPTIPREYLDRVAGVTVPDTVVTHEWIKHMALHLWDEDQARQRGEERDATAPYRRLAGPTETGTFPRVPRRKEDDEED